MTLKPLVKMQQRGEGIKNIQSCVTSFMDVSLVEKNPETLGKIKRKFRSKIFHQVCPGFFNSHSKSIQHFYPQRFCSILSFVGRSRSNLELTRKSFSRGKRLFSHVQLSANCKLWQVGLFSKFFGPNQILNFYYSRQIEMPPKVVILIIKRNEMNQNE